uniref:Uncharacterized protein n=1 Tax=Arundo donax TaxID=35708 RepID=A0A0A9ERX3_ARUDO
MLSQRHVIVHVVVHGGKTTLGVYFRRF